MIHIFKDDFDSEEELLTKKDLYLRTISGEISTGYPYSITSEVVQVFLGADYEFFDMTKKEYENIPEEIIEVPKTLDELKKEALSTNFMTAKGFSDKMFLENQVTDAESTSFGVKNFEYEMWKKDPKIECPLIDMEASLRGMNRDEFITEKLEPKLLPYKKFVSTLRVTQTIFENQIDAFVDTDDLQTLIDELPTRFLTLFNEKMSL